MTDRIEKLCAYLNACESFADIGCDHGYCTQYMLENGLCKRAQISDVSAKCLKKAENLLKEYIERGSVTSVCCNGLENIDINTEQVLIAGMGGEEIISILKKGFLPRSFVFQPMRNLRELREYLLSVGAHICADELFLSDGKYYFVIKGKSGGESNYYSEANLAFGLNLGSPVLKEYIKCEMEKKKNYLVRNLSVESRAEIEKSITFMQGVLSGEIK